MKLLFTASAEANLETIGDWIARDNPMRAVSFIRELRLACHRILDAPDGYELVPRFAAQGVRRKVHGNYLIFYVADQTAVTVIHVLHVVGDAAGAGDHTPLPSELGGHPRNTRQLGYDDRPAPWSLAKSGEFFHHHREPDQ